MAREGRKKEEEGPNKKMDFAQLYSLCEVTEINCRGIYLQDPSEYELNQLQPEATFIRKEKNVSVLRPLATDHGGKAVICGKKSLEEKALREKGRRRWKGGKN